MMAGAEAFDVAAPAKRHPERRCMLSALRGARWRDTDVTREGVAVRRRRLRGRRKPRSQNLRLVDVATPSPCRRVSRHRALGAREHAPEARDALRQQRTSKPRRALISQHLAPLTPAPKRQASTWKPHPRAPASYHPSSSRRVTTVRRQARPAPRSEPSLCLRSTGNDRAPPGQIARTPPLPRLLCAVARDAKSLTGRRALIRTARFDLDGGRYPEASPSLKWRNRRPRTRSRPSRVLGPAPHGRCSATSATCKALSRMPDRASTPDAAPRPAALPPNPPRPRAHSSYRLRSLAISRGRPRRRHRRLPYVALDASTRSKNSLAFAISSSAAR